MTAGYDDVIPIMLLHCTVCHGLRRQEGGLDLRTRDSMLRGGRSGPAMLPGQPADSLLLLRIESGEMPPKKEMLTNGVKPVTPAELANLKNWIGQGAPTVRQKPDVAGSEPDPLVSDTDRRFWAFQAPKAVEVPEVRGADRVKNPIDAFLLWKLEQEGLGFSPEAEKLTLIRRVYFDLTGLPPEPEEVREFLADKDPAPMKSSSTGCSNPLAMESAGEGTGWMSWAMPTRKAAS